MKIEDTCPGKGGGDETRPPRRASEDVDTATAKRICQAFVRQARRHVVFLPVTEGLKK